MATGIGKEVRLRPRKLVVGRTEINAGQSGPVFDSSREK
jgi:hypothetical protein